MSVIYLNSVIVDMTALKGKDFKMVADLIRSGIKNIHGYPAQKQIRDNRLKEQPLAIRFRTFKQRELFIARVNRILRDEILGELGLKKRELRKPSRRPVRFIHANY